MLSEIPDGASATVIENLDARFGIKDVAISGLERLLKISYDEPLTPALLRFDPDFDLLRGDPRFEKLISESGPK